MLPHRHPGLAAKRLATLDQLSNGRVIVGAGVGWMEEESTLLGAPYAVACGQVREAGRARRAAAGAGSAGSGAGRKRAFVLAMLLMLPISTA